MTQDYKRLSTFRYMLILVGMCGMIAAIIGLITNVSGLFYSPIMEDFGLMKGAVSLTLTISSLVFAVAGMFSMKAIKSLPLKPLLLVNDVIIVGCTVLLAMSPNIYLMYVLNAVRGFCGGLVGLVLATVVVNNWFVKNNALFTSIVMGFSGLAGALFSPFISSVIQSQGWRAGYLMIAGMMAVLLLPAVLFLPSVHPHEKRILAYGEESLSQSEHHSSAPKELGKLNYKVYAQVVIFSILINIVVALPQHFPGVAESYGLAAAIGTSMLSICMIMNTTGKIILGALVDRFGVRVSVLVISLVTLVGAIGMFVLHTGSSMLVTSAMYGCGYGGAAVGTVVLVRDLFGNENYGRVYPMISLVGVVSNAVFNTLVGYLYDFSGNYVSTLILMIASMILTIVMVVIAYRTKSREA